MKLAVNSLLPAKDDKVLLEGLIRIIRKALTKEDEKVSKLILPLGVIQKLLSLSHIDSEEVLMEIIWVFTNFAASTRECVMALKKESVHIQLVARLLQSSAKIAEQVFPISILSFQCLWCLSNMIGECIEIRDELINLNLVALILKLLDNPISLGLLEIASWTLSNICKGKPEPEYAKVFPHNHKRKQIKPAIPFLGKFLYISNEKVIAHGLWGLTYISSREQEPIKELMESINLKRISELITHENIEIAVPALRTMGNICSNGSQDVELALSSDCAEALLHIFSGSNQMLIREACWVISNIAAGPPEHIEVLIQKGIIENITALAITSSVEEVLSSKKYQIKKEAWWALINACKEGQRHQILHMVNHGVLEAMLKIFDFNDARLIMELLGVIDKLLQLDASLPEDQKIITVLDELGGITKLEELQLNSNKEIYSKATGIMSKYFVLEELIPQEDNPDEISLDQRPKKNEDRKFK